MNRELFLAILAMDSYNRGYGAGVAGLELSGSIGNATILTDASSELDANAVLAAGFYALAYNWSGETIISYRGTSADGVGLDVLYGWPMGGGLIDTQAELAIAFYRAVADSEAPGVDLRLTDFALTGHSLGGGLAGFVGMLYGQSGLLFDNEPFENAALNAAETGLDGLGRVDKRDSQQA